MQRKAGRGHIWTLLCSFSVAHLKETLHHPERAGERMMVASLRDRPPVPSTSLARLAGGLGTGLLGPRKRFPALRG